MLPSGLESITNVIQYSFTSFLLHVHALQDLSTLPDFLPILGPSLKNKNIIYAFGHQHLGWTLGAITGKIISKIVAGEKTNLDLTPYSSKRFN